MWNKANERETIEAMEWTSYIHLKGITTSWNQDLVCLHEVNANMERESFFSRTYSMRRARCTDTRTLRFEFGSFSDSDGETNANKSLQFFFLCTHSLILCLSAMTHSLTLSERKNYVIGMKLDGGKIDCSLRSHLRVYSVYITRFPWHFFVLHQRKNSLSLLPFGVVQIQWIFVVAFLLNETEFSKANSDIFG